jgi:hypothetical protein
MHPSQGRFKFNIYLEKYFEKEIKIKIERSLYSIVG